MGLRSPFRTRNINKSSSYEKMKEPLIQDDSGEEEEEEIVTKSREESEKTPSKGKHNFMLQRDNMNEKTPSPITDDDDDDNNGSSMTRKVLGEMTNDVSMTPLSAKLKNLKFSSPTDSNMSPATKFVNRKAHHNTAKNNNSSNNQAGSIFAGRVMLGLGRGKLMGARNNSRFAAPKTSSSITNENQ